VSDFSCQAALIVAKILQLYFIVMIVYALVSWVPNLRGRWTDYVTMAVEPVLEPVRRIVPPIAGFDVAFILVIILVQWLASNLPRFSCALY
jgi:YggT family protein